MISYGPSLRRPGFHPHFLLLANFHFRVSVLFHSHFVQFFHWPFVDPAHRKSWCRCYEDSALHLGPSVRDPDATPLLFAGDTWARAAFKTTESSGTALAVPQAIWTAWCSERSTFTGTQLRRPSTAPVRSIRRELWVRCQWLSRFVNLRARRGAPWILGVAVLSVSPSLLQSTSDQIAYRQRNLSLDDWEERGRDQSMGLLCVSAVQSLHT